jgi:hypothetical protein
MRKTAISMAAIPGLSHFRQLMCRVTAFTIGFDDLSTSRKSITSALQRL